LGLVGDSKLERLYRQARPMRVYEGSSEILRLGISKVLVAETLAATAVTEREGADQ
jgi:acyl-CoA dehydrogenase